MLAIALRRVALRPCLSTGVPFSNDRPSLHVPPKPVNELRLGTMTIVVIVKCAEHCEMLTGWGC